VSRAANRAERGFTVVEVLIALLVLLLGLAGILSLQLTSVEATAFSRHATEAAMLGEDKMEELRTVSLGSLATGADQVDALGQPDLAGLFNRTWTITPGSPTRVEVIVSWTERGDTKVVNRESYSIRLNTQRTQ
jgi:type IV pilus assembly protein PilV